MVHPARRPPEGPWLGTLSFRAMGCRTDLWVVAEGAEAAHRALLGTWAFLRSAEAVLSRFRPESELSRLNASGGRPLRVGGLLWEVLVLALEGARRTGGLYNPAVLPVLEALGYDRTFEEVRGREEGTDRTPAPPPLPWEAVEMDPETRTVRLCAGAGLDLGGIAKGWAAERACRVLGQAGPALANLGGDLYARGAPPGREGWPVEVEDPFCPDRSLAVLEVRDRGVATSGLDFRRWRRGGGEVHHLLDPRTGRPAETDLWTVTVIAPSGWEADLYALVVLLLGREEGARRLEEEGLAGLLVGRDRTLTRVGPLDRYLRELNEGYPLQTP